MGTIAAFPIHYGETMFGILDHNLLKTGLRNDEFKKLMRRISEVRMSRQMVVFVRRTICISLL